jgi:hypothetical protein
MTIQISNLRYADPGNTLIDMTVSGVKIGNIATFPFTYNPQDGSPVSVAVRALLAAGSYAIAAYTPRK